MTETIYITLSPKVSNSEVQIHCNVHGEVFAFVNENKDMFCPECYNLQIERLEKDEDSELKKTFNEIQIKLDSGETIGKLSHFTASETDYTKINNIVELQKPKEKENEQD